MAVGDAIVQFSGDNTALTYQPAAGVEVMVTDFAGNQTGVQGRPQYTDGTDVSIVTGQNLTGSIKMFINNTNYLSIAAMGAGNHSGFSGIQTK